MYAQPFYSFFKKLGRVYKYISHVDGFGKILITLLCSNPL